VTFTSQLPEGRRILIQYGELLQGGCFYRENLRTAKAEYRYTANGRMTTARPHFTFYGFRYVKVEGMSEEEIRMAGFIAEAIWSEMEQIGTLETSDHKVNRLITNALWSQRDNSVDIPTDCPQRDERMGWTGDAQAFSATACYTMYTPAFYHKYLSDMLAEQKALDGSVPFVVPNVLAQINQKAGVLPTEDNPYSKKHGSSAWGDAATVIPWNIYTFYGDVALLALHYPNMKLWVDYIRTQDNGSHLWQTGFHFGDWLALDGPKPDSCLGGTDVYFVASAYYYLSAKLLAKAAHVLGEKEDAAVYKALAKEIRNAMQCEYFTAEGTLRVDTQTAHVLALHLEIVPKAHREALAHRLRKLIRRKGDHLDTGFVGTYQLCPTLSKYGMTDVAYQLLFHEDYPSWLYQVNLGATTIWERWNSVLPDGSISGNGMNSMNHYANGSVIQWIYETVIGLRPTAPGFRRVCIAPEPTDRLQYARCTYESAAGRYEVSWERHGHEICYTVSVPFEARALLILPLSGQRITLDAGCHTFTE
jgi:alpha-L-rhamnosidase